MPPSEKKSMSHQFRSAIGGSTLRKPNGSVPNRVPLSLGLASSKLLRRMTSSAVLPMVLVAVTLFVGSTSPVAAQIENQSFPAMAYDPQVGQSHADFSLPDINSGQMRRLSDFRGKKVLLIHFASW